MRNTSITWRQIRYWPAFTAAVLISVAGCSENGPLKATVHGIVSLDGEPIPSGHINFYPTGATRGPSAGGNIINGKYEITGEKAVVVGKNKVEISSSQKTGKQIRSPSGKMIDEYAEAIPTKFNQSTTIVKQIDVGDNEWNFELKSK